MCSYVRKKVNRHITEILSCNVMNVCYREKHNAKCHANCQIKCNYLPLLLHMLRSFEIVPMELKRFLPGDF